MTLQEIAEAFDRDGYVLLKGAIKPEELAVLQQDSGEVVSGGWQGKENPTDYFHNVLADTGEDVFHRVQYIFPKAKQNSFIALLGHPFLLEVVQHILGEDFVPAAEALVFKMPGNGREVPVHADCDPADPQLSPVIFNVDYYLDDSSVENGCLWVAPGTHQLNLPAGEIGKQGFDFPGLIPVPVQAGDVLLHNVRLVHGSHRSSGSALRRTLYYEFQSGDALLKQGGPRPGFPATPEFVRDRFRLIQGAIEVRKHASYAQNETPFEYHLPSRFAEAFAITLPSEGEPFNLRPALGYNQYI